MTLTFTKKNLRCKLIKYKNLKTQINQILMTIKLMISEKKNKNLEIIYYKILKNKTFYKNNKIKKCYPTFFRK